MKFLLYILLFTFNFIHSYSQYNEDSTTYFTQKLTQQHTAASRFTDAAINSIVDLNSLIKKENYRNKISSFKKPTSSELGFNLQVEISTAQKPQSSFTPYLMYARHFSTNYVVQTGQANLVSRKMNISYQVGLHVDFSLKNNWFWRTGFGMHAHTLSEIAYGTSGNIPPEINASGWFSDFGEYQLGLDYIERFAYSFPLKVGKIFNTKTKIFKIAIGPSFTCYSQTSNETINLTLGLNNGSGGYNQLRAFTVTRNFDNINRIPVINWSTPFIEWQLDAELQHKLKKKGAIVLGIKANLGTTKFEQANFTIWPDRPLYKSTGYFSLNRSYIGVYAGFRFGKIK